MDKLCASCINCVWQRREQHGDNYYCRELDTVVNLQDMCMVGKFINKYENNRRQRLKPYSADVENDTTVEPAPFKYQGIPFDDVRTDTDDGVLWSKICGDHLSQYMSIFHPLLLLACEVNSSCQCGVFGCKSEAAWDIVFPLPKPQKEYAPERRVFVVRSFENIGSESQQDIYGVFEDVEDAIKCFNNVLNNEKEAGYFSDDEYSPFRKSDFNFIDEHHVYNNNADDWWECEIYSIPLNHSFA